MASCAAPAGPHNFKPPSVVPVKEKIAESKTHIKSAQTASKTLSDETAVKSKAWQEAYDLLQKELSDAYLSATTAEERADQLQTQNNTLATAANQIDDKSIAAEKREAIVLTKYHKVKWILTMAATGLAFLLLWQFKGLISFIPPPYSFIVILGAPAIAGFLVFLLL